jgi:hypothetical protein
MLVLAVAACKKAPPSAVSEGDSPTTMPLPSVAAPPPKDASSVPDTERSAAPPTTPGSSAPALPAQFKEFEAVLLPLTAEPEGEARSKKTCKVLETLRIKSLAVRRSVPAGADATAWEKASNEIRGAFEGLGPICTDDVPDDSADLQTIHQAYLRLVALLPQ